MTGVVRRYKWGLTYAPGEGNKKDDGHGNFFFKNGTLTASGVSGKARQLATMSRSGR